MKQTKKKKSPAAAKKVAAAADLTIEPAALKAIEDALAPLARHWGVKFAAREIRPFRIELAVFKCSPEPVNENLMKQLALIEDMDAFKESQHPPKDPEAAKTWKFPPWEECRAKEDAFWEAIEALEPKEGLVGRILNFPAADGYANYLITAVVGNKVEVCWIGAGDGWTWPGVDEKSMIDLGVAEAGVRKKDFMRQLFEERKAKSEA